MIVFKEFHLKKAVLGWEGPRGLSPRFIYDELQGSNSTSTGLLRNYTESRTSLLDIT